MGNRLISGDGGHPIPERARCGTLASQIGKFRNGLLHSVGRFVIFDRGFNG